MKEEPPAFLEQPTKYEQRVQRADKLRGARIGVVRCRAHGQALAEIFDTPEGPLFAASVPMEANVVARDYRAQLKAETGRRPPPFTYEVRVLIEIADLAEPIKVQCPKHGIRPVSLESLARGVKAHREKGGLSTILA